jgi:UDP-glucose 4-epimerase
VGDAADDEVVEAVFAAHGPIDAIIHLAAFKAVGESTQKPLEYYSNNVDTTFALLRVGLRHGISSFVFSSTGTVYSDPADLPFTEESATGIDLPNAYAKSKRINEVILADVARVNPELNVTVLRYFNPVGAHPSGLIGEDPAGIPNNLMPYVARVAVGRLEQIGVFGDDYDTPDGTGLRDYIHVVDLAEGHVTALERAEPGYVVYNLGTGQPVSVLDLIASFEKAAGRELPTRILARRPGDVATSYCDPSKAGRELDWTARLTIDDACRDYWHWQSRNPDGYATV